LKDGPRTVQQHPENRLAKQYQDMQQEILVRKLEETRKLRSDLLRGGSLKSRTKQSWIQQLE
jgi:hypothetical protein